MGLRFKNKFPEVIPLLPGIFMHTGYFLPLTGVFRPLTEKAFTFILDTV